MIETQETKILYGLIYSLSKRQLQVLQNYLKENLEHGWIYSSKSSAGAPVLFVLKKDSGLLLCFDYRGLNAITVKSKYPLLLISKLLDWAKDAKVYTKLDICEAY